MSAAPDPFSSIRNCATRFRVLWAHPRALSPRQNWPRCPNTPGHSGYLVEGDGKKLFLWGDIVHFPTFQPAWPDANLIFVVDPPLPRETRKRTFERAIADGLEIGGGHLLAPGFARVQRAGMAYRIVPSDG